MPEAGGRRPEAGGRRPEAGDLKSETPGAGLTEVLILVPAKDKVTLFCRPICEGQSDRPDGK